MFDFHGFEITVFKLLIGIILIVLYLRLTGKQQTAQLTPIDFIGNFILGGTIGGVIYNHTISFAEYISVLIVTLAIVSGLNYLTSKFIATRSLVMGKAYTIVEGGRFTQSALDDTDHKLDPVELLAELRGMGIFSLHDLQLVQREANGSLTVRRKGEGGVNYVLVSNGQIVADNLNLAHRDEDWLRHEISQAGVGELENIFLVELTPDNRLNIVDESGNTTAMNISDPAVNVVTTVTEFQNPDSQAPALEEFAADKTDTGAETSE